MLVVVAIVLGLIAVLIPNRTVAAAAVIVGTAGATLIKLTFRKD
ncbi:hypothetical protein [Amycolatopsis thailandensis]|nr:hypothetical protein [Amycolatopsis thailandensis]